MRAWRMIEKRAPLVLMDLPDPKPGPGEVVVAVRAAGICHSDLHLIDDDLPVPIPFTLGHESAGDVVEVGPDVVGVAVGDRVAVYGAQACNRCRQCAAGQTNICPERGHLGIQVDGGFAELLLTTPSGVVPIPEGVGYAQAAVCVDAVLTPYHALHQIGQLQPGQSVAIVGIGGLGSNAVQLAAAHGASVVGIDTDASRRREALELGAVHAHASVAELDEPVDLLLDLVGTDSTIAASMLAVRIGGRIVVVGLGARMSTILAMRLPAHEVSLVGSYWGTRDELTACLNMVASGIITPRVELVEFESTNEQLDRLRRSQVQGRAVLTLPSRPEVLPLEAGCALDSSRPS